MSEHSKPAAAQNVRHPFRYQRAPIARPNYPLNQPDSASITDLAEHFSTGGVVPEEGAAGEMEARAGPSAIN